MEQAKPKKRERMTPAEMRSLKHFVESQDTMYEAAEVIGTTYNTLSRVLLLGFGRPDTIKKIRTAIAS